VANSYSFVSTAQFVYVILSIIGYYSTTYLVNQSTQLESIIQY